MFRNRDWPKNIELELDNLESEQSENYLCNFRNPVLKFSRTH